MNTIIDEDAVKLADLQISTLQKVRSGHITLDHWERFNNLSADDREARFGDGHPVPAEPADKFSLLVDLGIITVPDDYAHENQLAKNLKKFYSCDEITDKNFPNPTRVMKPGDKFRIRVFKQFVDTTTSKERLAFLATQHAIHTGAQGASIVMDKKRYQLPKDMWYSSFDEQDRLWKDLAGNSRVPRVLCRLDGGFEFFLGNFALTWTDEDAFFCFSAVDAD